MQLERTAPSARAEGFEHRKNPERTRNLLLACGVLSSVNYTLAMIVGALQWNAYDSASQSVGELSAIGAPSRPIMVIFDILYDILLLAFAAGVQRSANGKRSLRVTSILLVGFGALCLTAPFTPMHQRGTGISLIDTLHIIGASIDVAFILLIMGFGMMGLGKPFRIYTVVSALIMLAFGALAAIDVHRIQSDQPTPWVGVNERISIGAYLLWFAVFAVDLISSSPATTSRR
jgi:hypothetical protein